MSITILIPGDPDPAAVAEILTGLAAEIPDAMATLVPGARCTGCGQTWDYRPTMRTDAGTLEHTTPDGRWHAGTVVDADVPATVHGEVPMGPGEPEVVTWARVPNRRSA